MNKRVVIVGPGRVGKAFSAALSAAGVDVFGPVGRAATGGEGDVVLLCVPDASIADAARCIMPGRLVGHCSGARSLDLVAPHEGFSIHPLMTIADERTDLRGVTAAVDGTTELARTTARELAIAMQMKPVEIDDAHRAIYHAAASLASNYLVTLETIAEELAAHAGLAREHLVPLIRASIDNWARLGSAALTGPIARGDEETVMRQRTAIAIAAPSILAMWDAMSDATRELARRNDEKES